jgi:hypothetical protein
MHWIIIIIIIIIIIYYLFYAGYLHLYTWIKFFPGNIVLQQLFCSYYSRRIW